MSENHDDLFSAFIEEATEHLSTMESDFLAMEKNVAAIDRDLVNKVFRAVHSIKGGAGFIGLVKIRTLSHQLETVLGWIRNGRLTVDSEIVNRMLIATDRLKDLVDRAEISDQMDITFAQESLDTILLPGTIPAQPRWRGDASSVAMVGDPESSVSAEDRESEKNPLYLLEINISERERMEAIASGRNIYAAVIDPNKHERYREKRFSEIVAEIRACGNLLRAERGPLETCLAMFTSILAPDDLILFLDITPDSLVRLADPAKGPPVSSPSKSAGRISTETPLTTPESGEPAKQVSSRSTESDEDGLTGSVARIRVNTAQVDSLVNLAGELVLGRNQLLQAVGCKDMLLAESAGKRLNSVTSDLQKVVMRMRMQPLESVFRKLPRMVRDLSRELKKEVELVIEGGDVELDRTLVEAIVDSLHHLIRNAVDHGLERPEIRRRMRKRGTGNIRIRAYQESGKVIIEVQDDGAGMDAEMIAQAAAAKGFVTDEQLRPMTSRDKRNLIFLPGFSTAGDVTEISGRGVGMDVVKTNLENLGGRIDIESVPGNRTCVRMELPLTLAIIPCQMVSVSGEPFAIPQMNIEELHRVPVARVGERIEKIGDAEVMRLRGKLLPLVRLADILSLQRIYRDPFTGAIRPDRRVAVADRRSSRLLAAFPEAEAMEAGVEFPRDPERRTSSDRRFRAAGAVNIVVVSTGRVAYGLIVDSFEDAAEIVVKPLGRHIRKQKGFAGATILGDGRVALILDIVGLAEIASLVPVTEAIQEVNTGRQSFRGVPLHANQLNLLVFRGACDESFAVPLHMVQRVERIRFCDIQTFGGRCTTPYQGENLPLFRVGDTARVRPLEERDWMPVVVFSLAGKKVGLLVAGPVDTLHTEATVDSTSFQQPGIRGSVVLQGKTTLLVDMVDLVRTVHPEWVLP